MFEPQSNNINSNAISLPPTPMSVGMDGSVQQSNISLNDVFQIIMRSKWWILASLFLGLVGAWVVTSLTAPTYLSTATILMSESKETSNADGLDALVNLGISSKNIDNEVELLKSKYLAGLVVDELLKIPDGTRFPVLFEEGKIKQKQSIINDLQDIVTIGNKTKTNLLEISTKSSSKIEAQKVSSLYCDLYLRWRLRSTRQSAMASRTFLERQADTLALLLKNKESELESFSSNQVLVAPEEEGRLLVNQIASLETDLDKVSVDEGVQSATIRSLQVQLERASPGIKEKIFSTAEPEIKLYKEKIAVLQAEIQEMYIDNPQLRGRESEHQVLINKIDNLNSYTRRLQSIAGDYLETNMTSVGLGVGEDATGIKGQLSYMNSLRAQILDVEVQMSGLGARRRVIEDRLGQLRQKYNLLPAQSLQLEKLKRNRDSYAELSKYVNDKLNAARIFEQSKVGNLEIIDHAVQPLGAIAPRRGVNLVLGTVLGIILGLFVAFFRNAVDQKVRKPEDLRKKGYSVLGVIPTMEDIIKREFKGRDKVTFDGQTMSTALSTLLSPLAPASEAYRRLRANIDFSRLDKQLQALVVTSAAPGEGKSVTALNLAIAMAQSGRKTIYVDADLRRPSGHKMLEMEKEPGLVETLFDGHLVRWEQFATRIDDLYLMPAGSSVPNPAELMGSKKMRDLISQLRNEFDVIIFDTPPVLSVTDGLLLASLVDACVVVLSASETTWQGIERTVDVLKGVGANVAGFVLNRFNPEAAYGYSDYYNSYGYSSYKRYYYDEAVKEHKTKNKPRKK